jgi:hypothetical protein
VKNAHVLVLTCCIACVGTDTGNPPLIDFGKSACHDQSYTADKGVSLQSLDQAELAPDIRFKGLTCIDFERRDAVLHFGISNYVAGCGSDGGWTPHVEVREGGGVDLILDDGNCELLRCGLCLYDLSFDVELLQQVADGEVHLYQRGCDDVRAEIAAPLALTRASDVACAYTQSAGLLARGGANAGERMLCGHWNGGDSRAAASCEQGLTCTELDVDTGAAAGGRCLRDCTSDVECDALSRCVTGTCQLSKTGLNHIGNE